MVILLQQLRLIQKKCSRQDSMAISAGGLEVLASVSMKPTTKFAA